MGYVARVYSRATLRVFAARERRKSYQFRGETKSADKNQAMREN